MELEVSEEVVLPVSVERAWAYLEDTQHLVEIDPLLESYEPENGVLEAGTTNRIVSRLGPLRVRVTTRTAELEPPRRVVFESVRPNWPLRITTVDTLEPHPDGTTYRVVTTIRTRVPLGGVLARLAGRQMMRTRRELMDRIRVELSASE